MIQGFKQDKRKSIITTICKNQQMGLNKIKKFVHSKGIS